MIIVPLFWVVHPMYLLRRIKQKIYQDKRYLTQREANKLMELPDYEVGKGYGEVLEILWFTFLYTSLIPLGAVISCLGLGLYYWIDKYNLLRRSSIHSKVSGDLIYLTLDMLDFTLVMRTAGDVFFDCQLRDGPHASSVALLVVAVLYQVLPLEMIIRCFDKDKFHVQGANY
jgi:hypothetical protein